MAAIAIHDFLNLDAVTLDRIEAGEQIISNYGYKSTLIKVFKSNQSSEVFIKPMWGYDSGDRETSCVYPLSTYTEHPELYRMAIKKTERFERFVNNYESGLGLMYDSKDIAEDR